MVEIKIGSKVYNKISHRVGVVIRIFKDKTGPSGKLHYTIRSGDDSIITDLAENFGLIYA